MTETQAHGSGKRQALRRYPAGFVMVGSALLATLLPSALRLPLSGPSATAELAPVPGESDGAGDISELRQSETLGLGAGGGGGGGNGGRDPGLPSVDQIDSTSNRGRNPRSKNCVGNPPRQTEDRMSPPCVAYFEGDNGGATAPGVTADEVTIVHLHQPCLAPEKKVIDYRDGNSADDLKHVAAFQTHFTERYQMYNRKAHFYSFSYPCDNEEGRLSPAEARAMAQEIQERFRPFAVMMDGLSIDPFGDELVLHELAVRGVFVVTQARRTTAQRYAPFMLNYFPDHEDRAEIEAGAVCRRLAGRSASYSGDPRDHPKERKFGLVYDPEPAAGRYSEITWVDPELLLSALKRRCGVTGVPVATGQEHQERVIALKELQDQGVTTVLYYGLYSSWLDTFEAIKWYPELFLGSTSGSAQQAQIYPTTVMANAFGLTYVRRLPPRVEQDWYLAWRENCRGCEDTHATGFELYQDLTLLFWGIQSAGPRLTPANVDRGLHAIKPHSSADPFTPAAYFAPGNYSWVKDAAFVWWDPRGRPPGMNTAGCYRMLQDGKRYRADEWPANDDGIKGRNEPTQPCQVR